jgi:hypothetical protein
LIRGNSSVTENKVPYRYFEGYMNDVYSIVYSSVQWFSQLDEIHQQKDAK